MLSQPLLRLNTDGTPLPEHLKRLQQMKGTAATQACKMAYLVSCYPAVSHTFILREVMALKCRGFDIDVASINAPDRDESEMNVEEKHEYAETYYVKKDGFWGALKAHVKALRHPIRYAKALTYAVKLGGMNLRRIAFGLFYFTEALMLDRWMQAKGQQHLHVHFATAAANVGMILKQYSPITLSLTVHGPDEFYDVQGQWLKEKIKAADFIICIGAFARSQLMYISEEKEWSKFVECPLGVDTQHYSPFKLPARSAQKQPFTVLCVGRLVPAKGQRILLNACHQLWEEGRDLRLVYVGTGPDEAHLRTMVIDRGLDEMVTFTGALNQDEVRNWYGKADLFALASFAEGIPVVLMEAMACGVPCISTRITGIPELIRDGVDGLLVSPAQVDELSDAIDLVMSDYDLRCQLSIAGRRRVQERYEISDNIERLNYIFKKRVGVAS